MNKSFPADVDIDRILEGIRFKKEKECAKMINTDEWLVFDSKFWKPETNSEQRVEFNSWSIEAIAFEDHPPKPKLCMKVLRINGLGVEKEFQTGNRSLIRQLKPIIERSQVEGMPYIDVSITRHAGDEYQVVDMLHVQHLARSIGESKVKGLYGQK